MGNFTNNFKPLMRDSQLKAWFKSRKEIPFLCLAAGEMQKATHKRVENRIYNRLDSTSKQQCQIKKGLLKTQKNGGKVTTNTIQSGTSSNSM